jgi:WD40 repeat protein
LDVNVLSPVLVTPTQPATIRVDASPFVEPKTAPFVVTAGEGTNTSTVILQVTAANPFPISAAPVRTTFLRTDEPVNSAVYDPVRKLVFATVHNLNSVEVFTPDGQRVKSIAVTRPFGIDQAPDGRILVGTRTRYLYFVDPDRLEVIDRVSAPGQPAGPTVPQFALRPALVKAAANGVAFVVIEQGNTTGRDLYQLDLSTHQFTLLGFGSATFDTLARSADYSTVVALGSHSAGAGVSIYDAQTGIWGPVVAVSTHLDLAVSPDGSQIVIGNAVYDRSLSTIASIHSTLGTHGVVFGRDGRFLYVAVGATTLVAGVEVYETQTYTLVGLAPSNHIDHSASAPVDVDETGMVFASSARGLAFVDASGPRALAFTPPAARLPNAFDPPQGPSSNPGMTTLNGVGFVDGAQVTFGPSETSPQSAPATNVSVLSTNEIRLTPPSANRPGPTNVIIRQPGGWSVLVPEAYTYGPHVLFVDTNAGPTTGGTRVRVYGYGFQFDQSQFSVTVGGQSAVVNSVFPFAGLSPFSFPLHNFEFTTPPGSPGWADLSITTPAGTTVVPSAFQFLAQVQVNPLAGALSHVIYDRARGRLYASDFVSNQVQVFDLTGQSMGFFPVGPAPSTLALTPDGARLLVGNSADNTITVLDPDNPSTVMTGSALDPRLGGCNQRLVKITPVKVRRVLVEMACTDQFAGTLHIFDASTLMPGCGASAGCAWFVSSVSNIGFGLAAASSLDGRWILGAQPTLVDSILSLWDVDTDFFITSRVGGSLGDAAVSADANRFAAGLGAFGPALQEDRVVQEVRLLRYAAATVYGLKIHPSGSLLYLPQSGGVEIYDVHRGRRVLNIALPDPIPVTIDALAIDEHGRKMFLVSQTGLTVAELAQVPLSIGYASPSQGPSSGGLPVTVRGSGFLNGATVSFGGVQVNTTFVDESTLSANLPAMPPGPVSLTVTNPDGRQYTLEAAFRAN